MIVLVYALIIAWCVVVLTHALWRAYRKLDVERWLLLAADMTEAFNVMSREAMRAGLAVEEIGHAFDQVRCEHPEWFDLDTGYLLQAWEPEGERS